MKDWSLPVLEQVEHLVEVVIPVPVSSSKGMSVRQWKYARNETHLMEFLLFPLLEMVNTPRMKFGLLVLRSLHFLKDLKEMEILVMATTVRHLFSTNPMID